MPLHAQRQRLHAAQGQEAVERPGDGADRVLQEAEPLGELGVLAHHQHAADHVGMAVEVLGRRMHDDVEAVLQRPLHLGAGEGVVGDGEDAALARRRRRRREVGQPQQRVGRRLDPDHPRLRPDRRLERGEVASDRRS